MTANCESALNEAKNILQQKSIDELNKLLNNEDEITKLIASLNEVQQMEIVRESLKENNKRIALRNLDREPTFREEKGKLTRLYEEVNKKKDEYKTIRQFYDDQAGETNPEMIYILLQTEASDLERKTEQSAEDFFYGEKTEEQVTEFEREFIEDRKRVHELKIKAEKFNELLQLAHSTSYLNSQIFK